MVGRRPSPSCREWEKEVAGILKKGDPPGGGTTRPTWRAIWSSSATWPVRSKTPQSSGGHGGGGTPVELRQPAEIGQASNRQYDANDRHIINIVDWLWRVRHLSSARQRFHIEPLARHGLVRFRIDGVLHQVYQMPMRGAHGDDQPDQDHSARMDGGRRRADRDGRVKTRVASGK